MSPYVVPRNIGKKGILSSPPKSSFSSSFHNEKMLSLQVHGMVVQPHFFLRFQSHSVYVAGVGVQAWESGGAEVVGSLICNN